MLQTQKVMAKNSRWLELKAGITNFFQPFEKQKHRPKNSKCKYKKQNQIPDKVRLHLIEE
jgi:hypothetical protein